MTESLTTEQTDQLRHQYHVFDVNGSGYIELDELKRGLNLLGFNITDAGLQNLLELVGSVDNQMNFEQFIAWNRELYRDEMKGKFKTIDTDHSGWISRPEAKAYSDKMEYNFTDEQIDDIMYEADLNEDGKIQLEEFITAMVRFVWVRKRNFV